MPVEIVHARRASGRPLRAGIFAGAALAAVGLVAALPGPAAGAGAGGTADGPAILRARCGSCHGEKLQRGGLNLSTAAGVRRGGDSGPAFVPGRPDESRLMKLVLERKMPPPPLRPLGQAESDVLRAWIAREEPAEASHAPEASQHQVLYTLRLRCGVCHGPRRQEGGLDTRTTAALLKGGKSGPAILPGNPEGSLLLKRIHAGEMPPPRRVVEVSVKPVEPGEAAMIAEWIRRGAPQSEEAIDAQDGRPDPLVSDADRDFWAFRPPCRVAVPPAPPGRDLPNPIDRFLLRDLRRRGLDFAPEADRETLLRRVSYDLTGLPPTPQERARFLADTGPGAYERVVDRLLASPHYGEKQARAWLDLAGYSDSEGIQDADPIRPDAWRYRDYLVRAFNQDRPYDRFLTEQIAGDELVDVEGAREITQEMEDCLAATGFLRMTPDATFAGITGFVPDRLEVIADQVTVLTSSVMGLTLRCARCHDHKLEPLPQRDYYRLLDIFKGAVDEHDWLPPLTAPRPEPELARFRSLPHVADATRRAWEAERDRIDGEIRRVREELAGRETEIRRSGGAAVVGMDAEMLRRSDAEYRQAAEAAERRIQELEAARPPVPTVRASWDRGEPSPTYLLLRGNYLTPGRRVGPGVPSVLTDGKTAFRAAPPWPGAKKTGRRLAFARWLTRPDHPLTARVIVNRVWKQHFGRGIVATVDNFGRSGARPTHPELLDWLAVTFASPAADGGPGGWRLKSLHRLMVTSRAYRQISRAPAVAARRDPDNRLYSRMELRRLDAEELYDTLHFAAGRLDERAGGPPDPLEARADGMVLVRGTEKGWRRALYALQRRKQPISLLETFDLPQMSPNCVTRPVSTVALQALLLLNNGRVRELSAALAARAFAAVETTGGRIDRLYHLALGRTPRPAERALALSQLSGLEAEWRRTGDPNPSARAFASLAHAVVNSAGLLYVD